jgi:hypothetical protein
MPLTEEFVNPKAPQYCSYCTNEAGELLPREQVQAGVAGWLESIAPAGSAANFAARADHYLRAMPAWAEE